MLHWPIISISFLNKKVLVVAKSKNKNVLATKKQFSTSVAFVLVGMLLITALIFKLYSFAGGPELDAKVDVPVRYLDEFASLQAKASEGCLLRSSNSLESTTKLSQLKGAYTSEKARVDAWMVRDGYKKYLPPDFEGMMSKNCPGIKKPT